MNFYSKYDENNIVRSLVIYEWAADFDMAGARDIFDSIIELVGRPADIATVVDDKKGKDYLYRNFVKRDIINKKEWLSFGYLWKRSPDVLSDFSIEVHCSIEEFRCFAVHIDEAAVDHIDSVFEHIIGLIVEKLQPIYGIGYAMPYYWGPRAYAQGSVSSRFATVDKTFYGAPERMKEQSLAFRKTYLADNDMRHLDVVLRDVFEINFLSKGHLDRRIGGTTLRYWIEENAFGCLRQLTSTTWRWDVPHANLQKIRKILIAADISVVKV